LARFGVELLPLEAYWKTVYYAILAERAGFDYILVTDHFNNRNVYVTLTAIANHTEKIKLGPGVTNPYLIHPAMTAQAVASLSELAPGRVVCGIGAGDKTTLDKVLPDRAPPVASVTEAVRLIRGLLAGEKVSVEGRLLHVSKIRLNFTPQGHIPILIGAQGPKMLTLAAELGDGVLINASHPKDIRSALERVKEGLAKVGRRREELEVVAATSISIHRDRGKAIKAATPVVAFIVAGSPSRVLQEHGISEADAAAIREAVQKGDWATAFGKVSPEMLAAFTIAGTPEYCAERVSELLELGVDTVIVGSPIGPNIRKAIDLLGREVLPRLST
jgi:5,10-methylenetetrahydromethanopterin reductase